jgi:DNA-binding PadR family transcriptional regulator
VSLNYAILSLLAHGPLSGYELMKLFDGSIGYFWHATHPQIYKELARLEHDGQVEHRTVAQRGRPTKKIYSLSDEGHSGLVAWLRIPARVQSVKDEMMLKTFACGLLEEEDALDLFTRHAEHHQARLERYQELERFLASGPLTTNRVRLGPYLTLLRGIRYERDYIAWCELARDFVAGRATTPRARARPPRRAARKVRS